MKRIYLFSPVGQAGGAEMLLTDVGVGLVNHGYTVRLGIAGNGPLGNLARGRQLDSHNMQTIRFKEPLHVLPALRELRSDITNFRPDAVVASHPKGHVLVTLARVAIGRNDFSLWTIAYDPRRADDPFDRISARLAVHRVAIAPHTARSYESCPRQISLQTITPGVDVAELRREAERGSAETVVRLAGLNSHGRQIVLMVARLQRFKGINDVLSVAEIVRKTRRDALFIIVGPDAPTEPGYRAELSTLIRERGLDGTVGLAGYIRKDDLAATMRRAACLIHPAKNETFGLVLLEALAQGTPFIAYAGPGPNMIAKKSGSVVADGDIAAMSREVIERLKEPNVEDAAQARTLAAMDFDISTLASNWDRVLRQTAFSHS